MRTQIEVLITRPGGSQQVAGGHVVGSAEKELKRQFETGITIAQQMADKAANRVTQKSEEKILPEMTAIIALGSNAALANPSVAAQQGSPSQTCAVPIHSSTGSVADVSDDTNSAEGSTPSNDHIFPDAVLSDEDGRKLLLHCAVKYGDLDDIKEVLLEDTPTEADKNAVDSNGRTAIDLAALTGQMEVRKLLAENGCMHEMEPKPKMIAICRKRQSLADKYLEQVVESL